MRPHDAAARANMSPKNPIIMSGNTNTRIYPLNADNSPIVMDPVMVKCPPTMSTITNPRFETAIMMGIMDANTFNIEMPTDWARSLTEVNFSYSAWRE